MSVQQKIDLTNIPFILQGQSNVRFNQIVEQIVARATALVKYTIMALKAVTVVAAGTPDGGNTGNGTMTGIAISPSGPIPAPGTYTLECTRVIANGGEFKLTGPGGGDLATLLTHDGTTAAKVFAAGGFSFTVTDGAVDFIVGDKFTFAVAAAGKWAPFDPLQYDGRQHPRGILLIGDIAAADLDAGDVVDRGILVGGNCQVAAEDIVFDDGVSTLDTVLSGGDTVRERLSAIGIFTEATDYIESFTP